MQTGSSGALIGGKSGKTTVVPPWERMVGSVAWTLGNSCINDEKMELFSYGKLQLAGNENAISSRVEGAKMT
jgi:hypothetical protein